MNKTMSKAEITEVLKSISGWSYYEEENCIKKTFSFKGFTKVMGFINAIAWIAQNQMHHPDVNFGYNYVTVSYQTHDANGITENDIVCAKKVNDLL